MPYNFNIDITVRRKLNLIERCLPFKSAIDFGGMWEVDGYYSKQCVERFGAGEVTMIDDHESANWKRDPSLGRGLDFRLGDFSDERFMDSISQQYDVGIAYDVILHQIDLRHTLSLMLSKVRKSFVVANPVIPDDRMAHRNSLVLLSGSRSPGLIPFRQQWTREMNYWCNFSDASNVNRNHWLWGMSPSFIESLMAGLGWRLAHREVWRDPFLQNEKWRMGGFVFKRSKPVR